MKCPNCGESFDHINVIESRPRANHVRRRRQCCSCQHLFTTIETIPFRSTVLGKRSRFVLVDAKKIDTMVKDFIKLKKSLDGLIEEMDLASLLEMEEE